MKAFLRYVAAMFIVAGAWQTVLGDEYYSSIGNFPPSVTVGAEKPAPETPPANNDEPLYRCNDDCCDNNGFALVGTIGADAFRNTADRVYEDNFGVVGGLNAAMPLGGLADYGMGWQLGTSYGCYDFDNRTVFESNTCQQQVFVTTGFYRKAPCGDRLSFGLVYDWMINSNLGITATDPTIGQWRGQVEWALSEENSVGLRGAVRDNTATQNIAYQQITYTYSTRGVSHADVFWHHEFESKADTYLWIGATQSDRLSGDHSLYDWLLGFSAEVPMSDHWTLYGTAEYVHPTSDNGGRSGGGESAYNVGMGFAYYFGGHARCRSIRGNYGAYMPVANNSTFIAEQNEHTVF